VNKKWIQNAYLYYDNNNGLLYPAAKSYNYSYNDKNCLSIDDKLLLVISLVQAVQYKGVQRMPSIREEEM